MRPPSPPSCSGAPHTPASRAAHAVSLERFLVSSRKRRRALRGRDLEWHSFALRKKKTCTVRMSPILSFISPRGGRGRVQRHLALATTTDQNRCLQLVCRCHRGKRERSPAMTIGASGGSPLGGVRRGAATADAAGRAEAEELGRAEAEEELGRAAHCARPPNTARPMSPKCSSGATLGRTAAATPPEDSAARSRQPSGVRTYRPCASNAALRRANL